MHNFIKGMHHSLCLPHFPTLTFRFTFSFSLNKNASLDTYSVYGWRGHEWMPRYFPSAKEDHKHLCLWSTTVEVTPSAWEWPGLLNIFSTWHLTHIFPFAPLLLSPTLIVINQTIMVQQPQSSIAFLTSVSKHQSHTPGSQGPPQTCSWLFTFNRVLAVLYRQLGPLNFVGAI